ncbi:hypothetical protein DPMN_140419 [Dreissena polymorpha]|uniref:Uncharacterized protein n=1 Tax=Dreissena polymorpha TaxID=45954 RepID=A0A9D4JJ05_DREPO|nr:hypothetical protein DPMN_140419 [Dreissena polymorpha]
MVMLLLTDVKIITTTIPRNGPVLSEIPATSFWQRPLVVQLRESVSHQSKLPT